MAEKGAYSPLFASEGNSNNSKYVPLNSSVEDAGEANSKRKFVTGRRKYFLAGFISILVVSVVTVAAVLGTKSDYFLGSRTARSSRKIEFSDVFSGIFSASSFSVSWIADDTYLNSNQSGVYKFDLTTKKTSLYISPDLTVQYGDSYTISRDKKWIMFQNNSTRLYRHSSLSDYYLGQLTNSKLLKLNLPGNGQEKIRYATWCGRSNSIVIVYQNNVYYKQSATSNSWYQITIDGVPKSVFNGVPDWVYEEEILGVAHAIECSEDGKYLIFAKFNSSKVRYYKFTKYGPRLNAYTSVEKIAYPKAGYDNPVVTLSAVDLDEVSKNMGKSIRLLPLAVPNELKGKDHYYYIMKFVTGSNSVTKPEVYVSWLNRDQNHTITVYYNLKDSTNKKVEEHKVKAGWVDDDYPKPKFSADGKYFVNILPKDQGSAGFFKHVVQVKTEASASSIIFLTSGVFDVHDIVCFNPVDEIVYFRSTEISPSQRHIYSVNIKTKKKTCLTCAFTDDEGCSYYYVQFSKQCGWGNFWCQGPNVPFTKLRSMKTNEINIMESNTRLKTVLKSRDIPTKHFYSITNEGFVIPVVEHRPLNFDENHKYAVLFSVYGGPGTQSVIKTFGISWDQFLVSYYDIIVVQFDARGCGYYGERFMHSTYKQLGVNEVKDANAVARHLGEQSYIDKNRISIWGWSYGGFYSASLLASPENLVKVAISVAPVSDWRYYDTIYTERYMGMPTKEDNLAGYEKTSVLNQVKNIKGKELLLVHGTGDDNVHVQQTMQLANALVSSKIQFRMQIYPDRTHSISSNGAYTHLFHLLTNFIEKKLKLRSN